MSRRTQCLCLKVGSLVSSEVERAAIECLNIEARYSSGRCAKASFARRTLDNAIAHGREPKAGGRGFCFRRVREGFGIKRNVVPRSSIR